MDKLNENIEKPIHMSKEFKVVHKHLKNMNDFNKGDALLNT